MIKNNVELVEEYKSRLEANRLPVIYNLRHLRILLGIRKDEQDLFFGRKRNELYHSFLIPKKNGKMRQIEAPSQRLLKYQQWIKRKILDVIPCSESAKGFKKNTSILDNAMPHVGKKTVINLDIKDFFPSVKYTQIFRVFHYYGYNRQVSHLLTKMCTNSKNVLPQGAPTSPGIANIVMLKLDKRMTCLAEANRCDYTRYADDITLSGDERIVKLVPLLKQIINEESFTVNEEKVRVQYASQRQEVTGLTVNKKVSVSKRTIKEIEYAIYYCSKYGVEEHMKRIKCDKAFYKEHLYGLAYYIHMIDKEKGLRYLEQLDHILWPY